MDIIFPLAIILLIVFISQFMTLKYHEKVAKSTRELIPEIEEKITHNKSLFEDGVISKAEYELYNNRYTKQLEKEKRKREKTIKELEHYNKDGHF